MANVHPVVIPDSEESLDEQMVKHQSLPKCIAKYSYWCCHIVYSILSYIGFYLFLTSNHSKAHRSTLDFKLAMAWHGFRVCFGSAALFVHSSLWPARIRNTTELPQPTEFVVDEVLIDMDPKEWAKAMPKCSAMLVIFSVLGCGYCAGVYYSEFMKTSGLGLEGTISNIAVEVVGIVVLMFAFFYRFALKFDAEKLRQSWAYVKAKGQ